MAFEKGENQNKLTDKNINKIIETYLNRVDVDKYARVASAENVGYSCVEFDEKGQGYYSSALFLNHSHGNGVGWGKLCRTVFL
ncbi:N-6 DNA methylase [Paenibacillus sp. MZ03-122A]|uniref:N-6 DNA methylase n=1 Tax=Paenibacillus sp. MZ03-122A TaxID=2962033 RepID=UPI0020B74B44|nr:N-6 DNA methylase [Paenibacillus sp. MZ03-122A]MCP3780439.1 N-6 DNA methylase [Paenibacillus sp. MZ03-122A]